MMDTRNIFFEEAPSNPFLLIELISLLVLLIVISFLPITKVRAVVWSIPAWEKPFSIVLPYPLMGVSGKFHTYKKLQLHM